MKTLLALLVGGVTLLTSSLASGQEVVMFSNGIICDTKEQLVTFLQRVGEAQNKRKQFEQVEGCGIFPGTAPAVLTLTEMYEDDYVVVQLATVQFPNGMIQHTVASVEKKAKKISA